jgi:hypothetical protein
MTQTLTDPLTCFWRNRFGGSDADWSNVSVTLESFGLPPLPQQKLTCLRTGTAIAYPPAQASEVVQIEKRFGKTLDLRFLAESKYPDGELRKTLFLRSGFDALIFREGVLQNLHVSINQLAIKTAN